MKVSRKPLKNGRTAFKTIAPEGYAIRMMEPGEVPALLAIERAAEDEASKSRTDIHAFTRFLLAREVFVAVETATGTPSGFATAAAETDLYWISRLAISPDRQNSGLGDGLLKAMIHRAHWFFYRALGISVSENSPRDAAFFGQHGFVRIPDDDLPDWLNAKRLADPSSRKAGNTFVMLKWI